MSADFDVVDALAGFAEDLHGEGNFAMRLHDAVKKLKAERDEARAELDFIKAEYGGADDDSLTRDALLLKLRLLESEMDAERASRRMYERAHNDILEALKRAETDAYHPEDGEPVALWGVERLAKERDALRAEVERLQGGFQRGVSAMREAAMDFIDAIDTMNPGYRSFIVASLNSVPVRGDK